MGELLGFLSQLLIEFPSQVILFLANSPLWGTIAIVITIVLVLVMSQRRKQARVRKRRR